MVQPPIKSPPAFAYWIAEIPLCSKKLDKNMLSHIIYIERFILYQVADSGGICFLTGLLTKSNLGELIMTDQNKKQLKPFRLAPNWKIMWNKLKDIEPDNVKEDDAWLFTFVKNMTYITTEYTFP